jgi:hypothetical protein
MRGEALNNSRRTHASSVHTVGGSAGAAGRPAAIGLSTALTTLDTRPPTYVITVPGSKAVGRGRNDGTAGGVTAVVTTAVRIFVVDDMVCAATELIPTRPSGTDLRAGCGSASTFTSTASTLTSTASTLLTGAGVPVDSTAEWADFPDSAAGSPLDGVGSFVGAVVSSSSFDDELVLAPPVLTTTPFGRCEVVDPVDVDVASEPVVCSVGAVAVALAAFVESDEVAFVDDSDVEDGFEGDGSGMSAHATPQPYPVTTAAPTPRATAKLPTRPT